MFKNNPILMIGIIVMIVGLASPFIGIGLPTLDTVSGHTYHTYVLIDLSLQNPAAAVGNNYWLNSYDLVYKDTLPSSPPVVSDFNQNTLPVPIELGGDQATAVNIASTTSLLATYAAQHLTLSNPTCTLVSQSSGYAIFTFDTTQTWYTDVPPYVSAVALNGVQVSGSDGVYTAHVTTNQLANFTITFKNPDPDKSTVPGINVNSNMMISGLYVNWAGPPSKAVAGAIATAIPYSITNPVICTIAGNGGTGSVTISHTYTTPGTYNLQISGEYNTFGHLTWTAMPSITVIVSNTSSQNTTESVFNIFTLAGVAITIIGIWRGSRAK